MNEKPEWMLYAAEVQKRIDAAPYNKGFEKRRDLTVRLTYQTAVDTKGYQGPYSDWDYLIRHVGKQPRRHRTRSNY
jgi:hypothetical protein